MKLFYSRRYSCLPGIGLVALLLIALGVGMPAASFAAPSARLVASRISGPAPLAVYFDATGTTDSNSSVDAFRQLGYRFTFGDPTSGVWTHTGLPKNQQVGGPLAAHVFEQPGTYIVNVEAKDGSGASSVATVTVTVQSPESAFPAGRTVCLSRTTDFTGCPADAQRLSNVTSWPGFQSGYRYLLHRGQDFSALGRINYTQGGNGISDGYIGPFGSGAKPIVGTVWIDSGVTGDPSWHRRVVIAELDAASVEQDTGGFDLLIFKNTLTRGGGITVASAFGFMLTEQRTATSWRNPENIFLVENDIDMNYAMDPSIIGIHGVASHFAIMGNRVDRTWEHNVRIYQAHKAFLAHNSLTGRCGEQIRGALKFNGTGTDPVGGLIPGVRERQRSSYLVIADNLLGSSSSNINWLVGTGPQNIDEAEGLEHIIWEDNQFRHGANYGRDITWFGRNVTERGNRNYTDNIAASYGVPQVSALLVGWNGPYYGGQPSMKPRFSGAELVRPATPAGIIVR